MLDNSVSSVFWMSALLVFQRWLCADIDLRRRYDIIASAKCIQTLDFEEESLTYMMEAARLAHDFRNRLLYSARFQTSPIGILATSILKPNVHPFEYYLAKYTQVLTGHEDNTGPLGYGQAVQVTIPYLAYVLDVHGAQSNPVFFPCRSPKK
jgi:hypothetical protein